MEVSTFKVFHETSPRVEIVKTSSGDGGHLWNFEPAGLKKQEAFVTRSPLLDVSPFDI